MFRGTKDIFNFTFYQSTKGKGYKLITIGIAVLLFVVFMMLNIVPAIRQLNETTKYSNSKMEEDEISDIEKVYVINNASLKGLIVSLTDGIDKSVFPRTNFVEEKELNSDELLEKIENEYDIILDIEKEESYEATFIVPDTFKGSEKELNTLMERVSSIVEQVKYSTADVSAEQIALLNSEVDTEILEVGKVADNIATMLIKYLAPMVCALVLYIMILFYGQTISKSVIAEKTSKLMEMLLTSVSPYAIIAGKTLAVALAGIIQFFSWIICMILGYFIGSLIANIINPNYTNSVNMLIDILRENADSAFSFGSIIIGVLIILIGFVLYCVLAALVASCINKAEDLSKGMGIYQIIVIIGFFVSYFVPISANNGIAKIVRIVPFTSVYILPADVIIGNAGIGMALISTLILIITVFLLILATGKVYKQQIFYKGNNIFDKISRRLNTVIKK